MNLQVGILRKFPAGQGRFGYGMTGTSASFIDGHRPCIRDPRVSWGACWQIYFRRNRSGRLGLSFRQVGMAQPRIVPKAIRMSGIPRALEFMPDPETLPRIDMSGFSPVQLGCRRRRLHVFRAVYSSRLFLP